MWGEKIITEGENSAINKRIQARLELGIGFGQCIGKCLTISSLRKKNVYFMCTHKSLL